MFRARLLVFSLYVSAAVTACSESMPTEPAAASANTIAKSPTGTDTSTTNPPPVLFNLSGRVLGVDAVRGQGSDTLHFTPIAGASVKLVRNVLVDGTATQLAAGETTSASNGTYHFTNLAGGYYIVNVAPPAGSPYTSSWNYVAGTAASVVVDVFLWRSR